MESEWEVCPGVGAFCPSGAHPVWCWVTFTAGVQSSYSAGNSGDDCYELEVQLSGRLVGNPEVIHTQCFHCPLSAFQHKVPPQHLLTKTLEKLHNYSHLCELRTDSCYSGYSGFFYWYEFRASYKTGSIQTVFLDHHISGHSEYKYCLYIKKEQNDKITLSVP